MLIGCTVEAASQARARANCGDFPGGRITNSSKSARLGLKPEVGGTDAGTKRPTRAHLRIYKYH